MERSKISIPQKVKKVLVHPSDFFEIIKDEPGIGPAFQYLALISIVIAVGSISYIFFLPEYIPPSELPEELLPLLDELTSIGIIASFFIYMVVLVVYFIGAGWMHIFVKLFRGKGDYSATYKANVYASTPSLLFGWIPIAGTVLVLYSIYLVILGLSTLHEVSMARAFGMFITSLLIIFVPIVALIVAVIASGIMPDISELLPDRNQMHV